MADDVSRLSLAVDSRQVRAASADLDRMAASGSRVERSADSVASSMQALRGALAGVSAALVARSVVQAADAYANLNARLRLVTKSAEDFARAQAELFAVAQRTGSGLEQTTDLFGSLSRSTEALGVSQGRVLKVTESINQAIAVSGTSAQSAAAALVQLGQGFASGTLRGEELNSILEQAPRLARAIADGLGVPVGKLRELGEQGQLTGEQVFKALERSGQALENEFRTLPLTVSRASTEASNALLKLIGTLDETSGTTQTLAEVIRDAAGFMGELATETRRVSEGGSSVSLLANAFVVIREALQVIASDVKFVFAGVGREIGAVAAQAAALARLDFAGFRAISKAVTEDAQRARAELDAFQRRILGRQEVSVVSPDQDARRGRGFVGAALPSGPIVSGNPKKEKISEVDRYVESLRKQLAATQDLTVVETLLGDIQAGRLGKVTSAQRVELFNLAAQIDVARALEQAKKGEAEARAKALELQARSEAVAADAADDLAAQNEALREEIELIGRSTEERARLQQARIDNVIAAKEEELIGLRNAEASRAEIASLERQIELLRQRRSLIGQRAAAEKVNDQFASGIAEGAKDATDAARQLGLTFSSAFEDAIVNGEKFSDVLKGIEKDILRIVLRKAVTEPLANGFAGLFAGGASTSGKDSAGINSEGGGFNWAGLIGAFLGGGRAMGGPVRAGGMYPVNENGGPGELLTVGNRQYLMATADGRVDPQRGGGGGGVTVNNVFHVPAPTDRRTQQQIAAEAGRAVSVASSRNG